MESLAHLMSFLFLHAGAGLSMVEDDRNLAVARSTMKMLNTAGKWSDSLVGECSLCALVLYKYGDADVD